MHGKNRNTCFHGNDAYLAFNLSESAESSHVIPDFPYHFADGKGAYCFQIRKSTISWWNPLRDVSRNLLKYNGKEWDHVIFRILPKKRDKIALWVNTKPSFQGAVQVKVDGNTEISTVSSDFAFITSHKRYW